MYSISIIDTSFAKAWERAVKFVRSSPYELVFGGGKEIKHALDSQTEITLDRYAIEDVLAWRCHPSDPWSTPSKIREYVKEYKSGFDASVFDYTYRDRLERGFKIRYGNSCNDKDLNQLEILREGLAVQIEEQLSSNRNIAITWNPLIDAGSELSQPCWNEILVRWEGDGWSSIHDLFRSHDLYSAWGANKIATTTMLYEEVIKPNKCKIKYVAEHNFSLHIYRYDLDSAWNIVSVQRNPQLLRVQEVYDRITERLI